jgi:hypothetical protein
MWGFKTARERAISAALSLIPDPRERIVWAYKYDIQGWTIPALQELILRRDPMSVADLELLGPDMTLCISSIREIMASVHSDTSRRFSESSGDYVNLEQIIQQECNLLECDRPILQSWSELEEWVADPDPVAPITWGEFVPVSSIAHLPGFVATPLLSDATVPQLLMDAGFNGCENVGRNLDKFTHDQFPRRSGVSPTLSSTRAAG